MEHLKETALQRAKETIHKGRIIEMERLFTLMPLEEIPVQEGDGFRCHALVKLQQLS